MQLELLGLLLLQPERAWTQQELTAALNAPVASVHRELSRAAAAGLIDRDATQRPHRYRAVHTAPAFAPMQQLLELTVGVPERVRAEFASLVGVRDVIIHGSWARGDLRGDSDLDVLVVGDVVAKDARDAARRVGRAIGREVDVLIVQSEELRAQVAQGHPLFRGIIDGPHIDVIGDIREESGIGD
ncbi:MAG: nucleotidyltransferase domain-containing protein [Solirubrobacteraceae bacterium]|jgi:predicted nucleotidyltransferase